MVGTTWGAGCALPFVGAFAVLAFLKPFDGFVQADFDTYRPEKWSSNLYNLQRMQVKQKLAALGAAVAPVLRERSGLLLDCETSAERPSIWNQNQVQSQWLYFTRDAKAQRDIQAILDRQRSLRQNVDDPAHHHRHMVIGVRVEAAGVSLLCAAYASAWLDRRNMAAKWTAAYERPKIMALLQRLDPRTRVVAQDKRIPLSEATEAVLDEVFRGAATGEGWIGLERWLPSDSADVQRAQFAGEAAEMLLGLCPFYRYFAWSKENDHASVAPVISQEKREKRRGGGRPFDENDEVVIVGGLFAGQKGHVQGFDGSGKVKVRVGNLTLPVAAGSLKRVER